MPNLGASIRVIYDPKRGGLTPKQLRELNKELLANPESEDAKYNRLKSHVLPKRGDTIRRMEPTVTLGGTVRVLADSE